MIVTNDRKNSDNELNDLLEAIMSDDGDLDVIEKKKDDTFLTKYILLQHW